MHAFLKRWIERMTNPGNLLLWVIASLAFAAAGPFGAYQVHVIQILPTWFVIVGASLLVASVIVTIREMYFADMSPVRAELLSCIAFALSFGPILRLILGGMSGDIVSPMTFLECVGATYIVANLISAVRLTVLVPMTRKTEPEPTQPAPRLARRLPAGAAGPILRLTGRDHFVEIVTPTGRHTVRMRLADAVAEMDGVEGIFTHRSHWVARDAIRELKRSGTKHYVLSADAEMIPVSRSNLPKLSEAGIV